MGLDRNKTNEIILAVTISLGVILASCVIAVIALLFVPKNLYVLVTVVGIFVMSSIDVNIWDSLKKPRRNLD